MKTHCTNLRNNPMCPFGSLLWNKYYWEYRRDTKIIERDYWDEKPDPDNNQKSFLDGGWTNTNRYDDILDYVGSLSAGKVLDIGCGPGSLLSKIDNDWNKYGVDSSVKAVEYAKEHATIYQGDFEKIDFKNLTFNVIIANHVIEHIFDPLSFIDKVASLLEANGRIVVGTPDFDSGCARRFGENYRLLHDPTHVSLFTSFSLVQMLEDYGFEVIKVNYPFFNTEWFTKLNMQKMFNTNTVSPPFYGNFVEVYAQLS